MQAVDVELNKFQMVEAQKLISYTMDVTASQALYWLDKCNYPYNRPINRTQVDILKNAINRGHFNEGSAIHFGVLNGKEYLLDGQHRLTAIVETGTSQPMTIIYGQVETFDEMAHIYARFDRHMKRTAGDTYAAFNLGGITQLQRKQMTKADSAIRLIMSDFSFSAKEKRGRFYTDFEVMDKIKYYQGHIRNYYELISGCNGKMHDALVRRSTFAIALATLDESTRFIPASRVYEFWQRVADGDKLDRGDARFCLREKLMITRISGGDNRGNSLQLSIIDACKIVALSWNSYIDNKPMLNIRIPDGPIPIKLTSHILPARQNKDQDKA